LLQTGGGSIQALRELDGQWQWAWREPTEGQDWLGRCIASVGQGPVFWTGQGDQAMALEQELLAAGLQALRPLPSEKLQWAPGLVRPDDRDVSWTVLGLASRHLSL
jgi:hypothetical protein